MKYYKIKKLINGHRVSPLLKTRTLIGIPFKYEYMPIHVTCNDKSMTIHRDTPLLHEKEFKDKFGRDKNYTLYYYEWCPNSLQAKLF
jgi:hypothetical protein